MMTPEEFAAEARGTLTGWLDGYTDPDAKTGMQHRVRLVSMLDEYDVYSVEEVKQLGGPDPSTAQQFSVHVTIKRHCDECADEDPASWCDCRYDDPGESCRVGPCKKRAHEPGSCPTVDLHPYSAGFSGMVCDAMVMRDGAGDSCGLPATDTVHRTRSVGPTR